MPRATLLTLPSEIRCQIWDLVFRNQHVVLSDDSIGGASEDCDACAPHRDTPLLTWERAYRPLVACKQMYAEARGILDSSFTLHLGRRGLGRDVSRNMRQSASGFNLKVARLELWAHVRGLDEMELSESISRIERALPNLLHVTVHAHMRAPDSYEKLLEAPSLIAPLVKLRGTCGAQVVLHLDYISHGVMFESTRYGTIMTHESLEEHEALIRELLDDKTFVSGVLSDLDEFEQRELGFAVVLTIARVHEQRWIEKLNQKRIDRLRDAMRTAQTDQEGSPTLPDLYDPMEES